MPYNDAQKRATMKYMKEKLDEIRFRVPKGKKDDITAHAEKYDKSMTKFLVRAVDETMEHDKKSPCGQS